MTSANTTYLITGANRGIGLGLIQVYLARPNTTTIAAVRDPDHPTSQALSALPHGANSKLILVKLDSASPTDAADAITTLQTQHNITSLDVVIANAGIAKVQPLVRELQLADLEEHNHVNVSGPVLLFQATLPLMLKAAAPKFVGISSSAASIAAMGERYFPNAAYGPSKVTLNYLLRKMHFEHEELTVFPIDPGFVQTELGNTGANNLGLEQADITVEESVNGVVAVIDKATRETHSGRFAHYLGGELPW
ncbi:hypothetical protein BP6252_06382 [Coleophoma cylindrospora]|uniref:Aflatoxin biosynthesis ketoreductase nor-1 n=1 Tax=Coleophoma cylindrospora TaxID=1849047 RepID=A0A3D8RMS5_9HELO|nr:hypothetical protein BP6252_06382 [Coleophoma cylindrospora]